MSKLEKIIWAIIMVILMAMLIALIAVICAVINNPEIASGGDSFNTALWVANPSNPASPVGMLLR